MNDNTETNLIILGIVIGLLMIPIGLGLYFWWYEPMVNPNNLVRNFFNATEYELSSSKVTSYLFDQIDIRNGKPNYCMNRDSMGESCIELNMTNPFSYIGKTQTVRVDTLKPICKIFRVWENGTTVMGEIAENSNQCEERVVASLIDIHSNGSVAQK